MLRRFEMFVVRPDADPAAVAQMRRRTAVSGDFIPEVLDSAVGTGRVGAASYYVWEHAYASPESYRRYMVHPYHANVIDRYLLVDSPERLIAEDELDGAGLFGYVCDRPNYRLPAGAWRRLILLDLAPGDEVERGMRALAATQSAATQSATTESATTESPGSAPIFSNLEANHMGACWMDAETFLTQPRWSHVWELGFATQAHAAAWDAESALMRAVRADGWPSATEGRVLGAFDVGYQVESA